MDSCCWNCNSPVHHRPSCPQQQKTVGAHTVKYEQNLLHRIVKPLTSEDRHRRRGQKNIRDSSWKSNANVSKDLISRYLDRRMIFLEEIKGHATAIEKPVIHNLKHQEIEAL